MDGWRAQFRPNSLPWCGGAHLFHFPDFLIFWLLRCSAHCSLLIDLIVLVNWSSGTQDLQGGISRDHECWPPGGGLAQAGALLLRVWEVLHFILSRCQFFVDILALHFRQLIKQSQSEGEAIGRSITNTFKTRFKKILDSSQVQTLSYDETGILTATFLKNSCDTESLKETQKMDMLERLLYKQGQHCKAGTRVLKCCKYPHNVHVWTFLCILFTFCQKNSKNFSLSDMDAWLTRKTGSIQASHMVAQQRKRKAAFDWFLWLDTALPNISL